HVRPPPGEFDEAPGEKTESPLFDLENAISRLRLIAFTDPAPSSFDLPAPGRRTIGRGQQADLIVNSGSISRVHAALHVEVGLDGQPAFEIEDLGSANGTNVQGRGIAKGERCKISAGEVFEVGAIMMMVQGGARMAAARPRRLWTH